MRPMMVAVKWLMVGCIGFSMLGGLASSVRGEHLFSGEQRPDLWPRPIYNSWVPYKKVYNRPRFVGGAIAAHLEPTSQEAMVWQENHERRAYWNHAPAYHPAYNYPKPWDVLPIDPRPAKRPAANTPAPSPRQTENQAPIENAAPAEVPVPAPMPISIR